MGCYNELGSYLSQNDLLVFGHDHSEYYNYECLCTKYMYLYMCMCICTCIYVYSMCVRVYVCTMSSVIYIVNSKHGCIILTVQLCIIMFPNVNCDVCSVI